MQLEDGIPCSETCGDPSRKANHYCDDVNNNCGCDWDGGDCCGPNRKISNEYCSVCKCIEFINDGNDFLSIHDGGSDGSEMVAKFTGEMNDTKISVQANQIFLVFHTNKDIVRKGFHALIMESKSLLVPSLYTFSLCMSFMFLPNRFTLCTYMAFCCQFPLPRKSANWHTFTTTKVAKRKH